MRIADSDHLFGDLSFAINRHYAVGEDEVARLQPARQRADDSRPDYQFNTGYRVERAPHRFSCATMPDSVTDHRKLFSSNLRAEALQAGEREWSTLDLAPLERRNLAREGVEDKNQSYNLIGIAK